LSVIFFTCLGKNMFQSYLNQKHRVLRKNKVNTYRAPVFHLITAQLF
jgi:hypothetical protein